jgi:hypothetical protein
MTLSATPQLGSHQSIHRIHWLRVIGSIFALTLYTAFYIVFWGSYTDLCLLAFEAFNVVGGTIYLIVLIVQAVQSAGTVVELYEGGIIHRSRAGTVTIGWNEIETIWFTRAKFVLEFAPALLRYHLRLRTRLGHQVLIPRQLSRIEELGQVIIESAVNHMLPEAIQRIEDGNELHFGRYRVSSKELIVESKPISWKHHPSLSISDDGSAATLHLSDMKQFKSLIDNGPLKNPTKKIPNLFLLMALLNYCSARYG